MAVLIGMSGDVEGRHIEVDRDEVSIGRSQDNTIVIEDAAVSGRHCSVLRQEDGYLLRDNGSTNGTRLNSRDVKESRLRPKDIIRVGSVEFMFDAEEAGQIESAALDATEVEIDPGPAAAPQSFDSISPFGARKEGGKGWWYILIVLVGILALAAVALLFFNLATAN